MASLALYALFVVVQTVRHRDYFLALATRSDDEAAQHAAMAVHYRSTKTLTGMAPHCDRLASEIRAVASEARAAATMHGTLASAAK